MDHLDTPDLWRERFVAALRLIGSAAARLPYGVPEPAIGGEAAIELYSGGLWSTLYIRLLTTAPFPLQAELIATGFRRGERVSCEKRTLWHPALDLGVSISARPPVEANVVAVEIGTAHDVAPLRVVGLEDLIVDQIAGWLGQGGRSGAMATRIQVLVELGRAGVGGPFRAAYLQRRLARETKGEAILEPPPSPYNLDDPLPRTASRLLSPVLCGVGAAEGICRSTRPISSRAGIQLTRIPGTYRDGMNQRGRTGSRL